MTLAEALVALERFYGRLPSPPRDPFALFVWEVLAARAPAVKRDAAFTALRRIPALTPDAVVKTPAARLREAVALAGSHQDDRIEALLTGANLFRRQWNIPALVRHSPRAARRALAPLSMAGESLWRRMLLFAGGWPALPYERSIARVGRRLAGGDETERTIWRVARMQRALEQELKGGTEVMQLATVYFAHHGQATCTEREPHCRVCPLASGCLFVTRT